jgi:dTDP-4-dehydrorhamnose 3,5-epimerase
MKKIKIEEVEGAYLFELDRYEDNRGFFQELDRGDRWDGTWQQASYSQSYEHVVRGIHQSPYPKLVTCLRETIYDVMVDLRPESPTFLNWFGIWLSEEEPVQVFIPAHCGHGFMATRDDAILFYLQGGVYDRNADKEWNWQSFGITWPDYTTHHKLSEKDSQAPFFSISTRS